MMRKAHAVYERMVWAWRALLLCSWAFPAFAELPDTIERIKPSIVGVGTYQKTRTPAAQLLGSGFVVGNGRYVVTSFHVVDRKLQSREGERLAVFAGRGPHAAIRRAGRIAVDARHDLAILRISGPPLPALQLGDSDRVREGELYAFTGFPIGAVLGLYPVTHRGIVSAITPIVTPKDHDSQLDPAMIRDLRRPFDVFQLDATAYPGNSGSPLYDPRTGRVVGVINMVLVKRKKESALSDSSGITYAIPGNFVRDLMERSEAGRAR